MNKSVLIVDDDPAILAVLRHLLERSGWKVLSASSGREALKIILDQGASIIITDWDMPEMDGLELARAVREHEGIRFVYLIIATSYCDTDHLVRAFEAGADDFVTKPLNRHELLARLRAGERIVRLEEDLVRRRHEVIRLNAEMAVTNEKLEIINSKLKTIAAVDELTGLLNRREGMARLHQLWSAAERYGQPLSCIMIDIDHFKRFNDRHGHAAGDLVLKEAATAFQNNVRSSDLVCRIGGEEFLVICPHVDVDGARICAEKLRDTIASLKIRHSAEQLSLTISAGVAQKDLQTLNSDQLLQRADMALYASKENGRNRVTVWSESLVPTVAAH